MHAVSRQLKIEYHRYKHATFCVMILSVWGASTGLLSRGMVVLTIINGVIFLTCLLVLVLHASGKNLAAKFFFLFMTTLYVCCLMLVVGPFNGLEYFLPASVVFPILLFSKQETSRLRISIALILLAYIGAFVAQHQSPFVIEMSATFVHTAYYVNVFLLAAALFLVVNFYNNFAASNFHALESRQSESEVLINSLLPAYIAEDIRNQNSTVAHSHSEATVLIASVIGFETLYNRVSAIQLVEFLSDVFSQFDILVTKYEIEKVNTLGTNYVVASGLGSEVDTKHDNVALFALEALEVVREFSNKLNHPFSLRAGISTGQVVSGVIGDARPCFDIWGETVELANSMRDTAIDNSIKVNEPADWRLKDRFDFAVTDEPTTAYLLLRLKSEPAQGSENGPTTRE